jgi:hypothetical protein
MGRKVLKGLANNLCQIFLGYQCYQDLPEIERLGKGRYEIDILTTICKKDGMEIDSFLVSGKLQQWFFTQVRKEKISLEEIRRAVLIVDVINIQEIPHWLQGHGLWKSTDFSFECISYINAFGREYIAQDTGGRELG